MHAESTAPFPGFTPDEWERTVGAGFDFLCAVARAAQTASYSQFCGAIDTRLVEPDSPALGAILADIARRSLAEQGVILPAVLVTKDGQPGFGFFAFAMEAGQLPKKAKADARFEFWARHLREVHLAWKAR